MLRGWKRGFLWVCLCFFVGGMGFDARGGEPRGDEPRGDEPRGDELRGDEPRGDELRGDEPRGDESRGDELRGELRIAMVVNGTVKTVYDVDRRLSLVLLLSGRQVGRGERESLWSLVRDGMVEELLKKQVAEEQGVVLSAEVLEGAFVQVARRVGVERSSLSLWLLRGGIFEEDLQEMLRNEGLWTLYRQDVLARSVVVSSEEVEEEQRRVLLQGVRFLLSRIGIGYEGAEERVEVLAKMESVKRRVEEGGLFSVLAKNFSEDEYGEGGGLVGWVAEEDLPLWQRGVILETDVGDVTRLMVGEGEEGEGEVVLMRVEDREEGGEVLFDEVRNRLFATKLNAQVRRRLKVVRENAYVDVRL